MKKGNSKIKVKPEHVAYYMEALRGRNSNQIARIKHVNRGSVYSAIKTIRQRLEVEPAFRKYIASVALKNELKQEFIKDVNNL